MYGGDFFWVKYSGVASKDLFDQIISTFKFVGSSEKKFFNTSFGMEFTLPTDYVVRSNHYGITDPTKAEAFYFVKESNSYTNVTLDVSENLKSSSGQTLQQLAQSIYEMNKAKNYTTSKIENSSYGDTNAYEFNLQTAYIDSNGGKLLESSGGKVVFLQHGGKIYKFLLAGADSGLTNILNSLKFK
jgi:hypothetical protein